MALLSADRTCQGRTSEPGAAKENRPPPRPRLRGRRWCLKTSKTLFFAGAASEDTALRHSRHICCRRGKCFASSGSINSAFVGCFPYGAGGEREGNRWENCRATCFHGVFAFFHCTCPWGPDSHLGDVTHTRISLNQRDLNSSE